MNQSLYAVPAALNADCYKSGHIYQYPEDSTLMMFNMTARSDKYLNTPLAKDGIIAFGIRRFCQDYLMTHWNETFFKRDKKTVVDETMRIMNGMLYPHKDGTPAIGREHWEALHDLGYLPVMVDAVPEGTLLPIKVPMLNFQPTLTTFAWVAGYLEDAFSNELWKATCIATIAFHYRRILENWAAKNCDNNFHVPYQGHDFALRGLSGMNDGAFNSIGHLTSFKGTDDFAAVYTLDRVYGGGLPISEIAGSIPATEHSVMVANILLKAKEMFGTLDATDEQRGEAECEVFKHFITEVYPDGLVSLVSDSFNYFRTIDTVARKLRDVINAREGKLVFRPDSGDPFHIICGYKAIEFTAAKAIIMERLERNPGYHGSLNVEAARDISEAKNLPYLDWIREKGYEIIVEHEDFDGADTLNLSTFEQRWMPSAEIKGSLETLWGIFGGTINSKGFRVLNEHVGLIYGDSITMELADKILERMDAEGFAASNIVFGIGSYTYQMITRDTLGFAVKSTYIVVNGVHIMLSKEPVTDLGLKKSAKGCVVPVREADGSIVAVDQLSYEQYERMVNDGETLYQLVFSNSKLYNQEENTLELIRKRIDSQL